MGRFGDRRREELSISVSRWTRVSASKSVYVDLRMPQCLCNRGLDTASTAHVRATSPWRRRAPAEWTADSGRPDRLLEPGPGARFKAD
jgi:hypothetical protein